jgi:hypothetical protein
MTNEYMGNIFIVIFVGLACVGIAFIPSILVWINDWRQPETILVR